MKLLSLLCLLWGGFCGFSATAENSETLESAKIPQDAFTGPPAPQWVSLRGGPPIRTGHAYRLSLTLVMHNPASEPTAAFKLSFVYTTADGRRIKAENLTLPSTSMKEDGSVLYEQGLVPGERIELSGDILLPAAWYRGRGQLSVLLLLCQRDPDHALWCGDSGTMPLSIEQSLY